MQRNFSLIAILVIAFGCSNFALADQKIKTKSNIKNDRMTETSSAAACTDTKEGSADGKSPCKTGDISSSASSASSKESDKAKPQ
ncbi:MAG: hypothetical protein EOO68_15115 [Moraxellaceae bacterium]|nr:MAG: hypothetical protein EOO68_15115 [Moraxellaceae bacterium]